MTTILTDDEIGTIQRSSLVFSQYSSKAFARAVEAAVLAKLAQQEPIGYLPSYEADRLKSGHDARLRSAKFGPSQLDGDVPLYTHPAPQQADRPRVPDELDWRHPRIQALIGADARSRICIDLVWRILENPRGEFTASDMEYWDKLHDKVQEVALAAAPEAPAQANCEHLRPMDKVCAPCGRYPNREAPAQADACCGNWAAGTSCFADPKINCPRLLPAPEAPAPRTDLDVTLTRSEVEAIGAFVDEEMSESDEEVVRLMTGGGHSGHGLYAACPDYPEEGAILVKQLPAPEAPAQASAVDERAAFEAWWEKQTGFAPQRDANGDGYVFSRTEHQWDAWQARAALAQKVKA